MFALRLTRDLTFKVNYVLIYSSRLRPDNRTQLAISISSMPYTIRDDNIIEIELQPKERRLNCRNAFKTFANRLHN